MGIILDLIRETLRHQPPPGVGTSLTRAHTGRVTDSLTVEEQVCERLVKDWLKGRGDSRAHCGERLVTEMIGELPRCRVPSSFRARPFSEMEAVPTNPLDFGVPENQRANRYNRAGQRALYLGLEVAGLRAEMEQRANYGDRHYYARYNPIDSLSIIDISERSIHAALHFAFDFGELEDEPWDASQRLADIARSFGIDGMIVPSVRGNRDRRYQNAVLFNCGAWKDWVDASHPPKPLP
jgi:hypothetical protein